MKHGVWVTGFVGMLASCLAYAGCSGSQAEPPATPAGSGGTATADAPPPPANPPPPAPPQLTLKEPIQRGDKYVLEFGSTLIEVAPEAGGRISRFERDGKNILVDPDTHDNWGSTYWTSPQSDWGWPPVKEIDSEPYTAKLEGQTIVLSSKLARVRQPGKDKKTKKEIKPIDVVIEKRIAADLDNEAVDISYTIINKTEDEAPRKLASWEISRVFTEGISFFPKGSGEIVDKIGDFEKFPYTEAHGAIWFEQAKAKNQGHTKLVSDGGAGWLAHVTKDGLLFLKLFEDVPADVQAPGEGEVEIFANSPKNEDGSPATQYVEVENQGPYVEIGPGKSSTYKVKWLLRNLPEGLDASAPSPELAEHVKALAK